MYEYTLVFLYDEDEHDVFILDEGKEAHAIADSTGDGRGGIVKKKYHSTGPEGEGEFAEVQNRMEHVQIPNTNGTPPRETDLLDGKGQRLDWNTDNSYANGIRIQDAVWLRWKIYGEAEFGNCKLKIRRNGKNESIDVPWGGRIQEDYSLVEPIVHTDTDCGAAGDP